MTVADIVRADLVRTHAVPAASAAGRRVRRTGARRFRLGLFLSDLTLAAAAASTTAVFSGIGTGSGALLEPARSLAFTRATGLWCALLPLAWVFLVYLSDGYRGDRHDAGVFDLRRVLTSGVVLLALLPLAGLVGLRSTLPDMAAVSIVVLTVVAVLTRVAERRRLRHQHDRGIGLERVAVIGDPAAAEQLVALLERDLSIGLSPAIVCLPRSAGVREVGTAPVVAGLDDPDAVVRQVLAAGATALTLTAGPGIDPATLRAVARSAEWAGLTVMFAPNVVDIASTSPVVPVAGSPILRVVAAGPSGVARFTKYSIDKVGAALGLVVLAPVIALLAVLVRLDSRGPAFFRQRRVGAGGREFTMLKFRSMHTGAEDLRSELDEANESSGRHFKLRADPRVTRVGRLLRTTSLDELPQLVNVLRGEMSLVGPRPPLPSEVALYTQAERRRLLVRPGVTGLWQVSGRSNLDWVDAVRLDLSYVSNWSVSMDLRLLARTAAAVARREGAY